jgi:hypothetical protein
MAFEENNRPHVVGNSGSGEPGALRPERRKLFLVRTWGKIAVFDDTAVRAEIEKVLDEIEQENLQMTTSVLLAILKRESRRHRWCYGTLIAMAALALETLLLFGFGIIH